MARLEHDRENLLRDAVAMVERIAWHDTAGDELFVGFRKSGAVSVYFDQDPAYHFNSRRELRRGYVDGKLLKAKSRQLWSMHRQRPGGEVQLVSRPLDASETLQLLQRVQRDLQRLADDLANQRMPKIGCVPDNQPVAERVADWLAAILKQPIGVANSPHAR